jgi:hypothetical protein
MRVLLGEAPARLRGRLTPTRMGLAAIEETTAVHSRYAAISGGGTHCGWWHPLWVI